MSFTSPSRAGAHCEGRWWKQDSRVKGVCPLVPPASESCDGVLVSAFVARYQSMGLATPESGWKHGNKPEDIHKMPSSRVEVIHSKIALKNNVIWNLPKNCTH